MAEHYEILSIEPIDFMQANFNKEELKGFYKGNITKYAYRRKGQDLEDAKKIQVYARWLELLYDGSQVDEQRALHKLVKNIRQSNNDYKRVVSIGRGGAYVASQVAYALDLPLAVFPNFISFTENKSIYDLYIDDIEDTSGTIEQVKSLIGIDCGVLVQKDTSKALADFVGHQVAYNGYINFTFQSYERT